MSHKVVICGAGFLGFNVAKNLLASSGGSLSRVQLSSRRPEKVQDALKNINDIDHNRLLPPLPIDITDPESLDNAMKDADVVVSLVGLLRGTPESFERIQWRGAENVARTASKTGAKLIHFSAIGADVNSPIPYWRTKALGEEAVYRHCPDATVFRPSVVFGPGDGLFMRFSRLSKVLPFMPVFGGGTTRFQPVFVGDVARAVQAIVEDEEIRKQVSGKVIEAGGPDILTYKEIIELVLLYTNRWRPIVSIPYSIGMLQGAVLERFPDTMFTITRNQIEQLKADNIVTGTGATFSDLVFRQTSRPLTSVHAVLPTYLK
ncbi:NAD(P)-binding protein [Paxillus ammoniavirescens]|nr:NAD(P)-binding protein [Paxillus ammoniavirescens]